MWLQKYKVINQDTWLVCYVAQEASLPLCEYIDRKFPCICSSMLPLRNKMIFAMEMPSTFSSPHTEFEQFKHSRDMRL